MQNPNTNMEDKFGMNFTNFEAESLFNSAHMGGLHLGMKRTAHDAGLDREPIGLASDEEESVKKENECWPWDSSKDPKLATKAKESAAKHHAAAAARENLVHHHQTSLEEEPQQPKSVLPNGKKTKGRVKIKMEFIDNKLRRYTTFSKRKTGIMKKVSLYNFTSLISGTITPILG